ncbi:MAG: hypothetical protein GKR93_07840 [Gammaproteobacteria bacterium]|nr:hypothetical protein [Gammaproteobacteria bacterium]
MSNKSKLIPDGMRADKWLWCARFYKTRSLANSAIRTGKIKLAGLSIKSGKEIKIGDEIEISQNGFKYQIEVTALAKYRGSAASASLLYEETAESLEQRRLLAEQRKIAQLAITSDGRRPNKQQRRKIIQFTRKSGD